MNRHGSVTAWCGRLLLCAVLLLGVFAMHTLGHPVQRGSSHMSGGTVMAAGTSAPSGHSGHAVTDPVATDETRAGDPAPTGGMDPMSVCLAVLSVWTSALVAIGALSSRPADLTASALARLWHALRPIPPPGSRRMLLARLSVLRL